MPNTHLFERLRAAQASLMAHHGGGNMMSTASRGKEREDFVYKFLSQVLPPIHRFGSGDIIDSAGQRSGQVDIVIEYPLLPSLPQPGGTERLYLAESVAAVIEVKSDLSNQWDEVEATAREVKKLWRPLRRDLNPSIPPGQGYPDPIPVYAVGYRGWKQLETLKNKLDYHVVNGALVIEGGLFSVNPPLLRIGPSSDFYDTSYSMRNVEGPMALWALICSLHEVTHGITHNGNWILNYGR